MAPEKMLCCGEYKCRTKQKCDKIKLCDEQHIYKEKIKRKMFNSTEKNITLNKILSKKSELVINYMELQKHEVDLILNIRKCTIKLSI